MNKSDISKIKFTILYGILASAGIIASIITAYCDYRTMQVSYIFNIALSLFGIYLILIMAFGILRERVLKKQDIAFIRLLMAEGGVLFCDWGCYIYDGRNYMMVKLFNSMVYAFGIVISVFFWHYVINEIAPKTKTAGIFGTFIHIIAILDLLALVLNWKFEFLFYVSENAVYNRAAYNYMSYIVPFTIMLVLLMMIMKQRISNIEKMVYLSYEIFPAFAMVFQMFSYGLSILYLAILLAIIMVYGNIYTQKTRKIAIQEKELAQQNMSLMISQIQPHFLYNSLTTISNLCRKDPEEAEEMTIMFAKYLRMNLDALKNHNTVLLTRELEHVKIYLKLEQKRFGDYLNVEYDIKEKDFFVPCLSIQPIVENSVKHGICEKGEAGTVKISSYAVDEGYCVVVEDDGVGFDPSAPRKNDGKSHVGMQNVIDRLEVMCKATVTIESSPGNGCKTTIFIPELGL